MLGYDLKQAFTYFFNKKNIGVIIGMTIILYIPLISILLVGFLCTLLNQRIHKPDLKECSFDIGKYFTTSIALTGASLVYNLPIFMLLYAFHKELIGIIITLFVGQIILIIFSTNLKFKSAFDRKLIEFIFVENFFKLIGILLMGTILDVATILIGVTNILAIDGPLLEHIGIPLKLLICLGSIVLIPLVSIYLISVKMDLYAQFVRKIYKIGQEEVANG